LFPLQYFELADRLDQLPNSVHDLGEGVADSAGFGAKEDEIEKVKNVTRVKSEQKGGDKLPRIFKVEGEKQEAVGKPSKISEVRVLPPSNFLRRSQQQQPPEGRNLAGRLRRVLDREARSRVQLAKQFAPQVSRWIRDALEPR